MNFDSPQQIEQTCYEMRLGDYNRAQNRTDINRLFDGWPPYSPEECERNHIEVNFNDLTGPRIAHDARGQMYNNFLKPGNFFRANCQHGPRHKRAEWSQIVTSAVNRLLKQNRLYFESFRSKIANNILHGIAPTSWDDRWNPIPRADAISDIMIPGRTELHMSDLPFFARHRSWSYRELHRLTKGPRVDPGWNMQLVDACLAYIDQQSATLMNSNWPDPWQPEKMEERMKGDGAWYAYDEAPTIEAWDFLYYHEDDGETGWRRRIILDAWSPAPTPQGGGSMVPRDGKIYTREFKTQWLYNSENRVVAPKIDQLIAFQFADLSCTAPFQYHSVRSLGFLLYAVLRIQNRLRCSFTQSVFEGCMQYFRVKSADDIQRALKVELVNYGFVDDMIQFVPPQDRWQVNAGLVQLGLKENDALISAHSSSYSGQPEQQQPTTEKTKFEVMARVQSSAQMIGTAVQQAASYQEFEYAETFRRFLIADSPNALVREFRASVLSQGVDAESLKPEYWDIAAERMIGQGNLTLEGAIANQLMEWRASYDPEAQTEILRRATFAVTQDAGLTTLLVPDNEKHVSDSIREAESMMASLMQGLPASLKPGINMIEVIDTMLHALGTKVGQINQSGGMTDPKELAGLQAILAKTSEAIDELAKDEEQKARVRTYGQILGKLDNFIKAFAQRLQEQMQKQAEQSNAQGNPEAAAKVQAMMMLAQAKAKNLRESHAQKTAQRQIQFEHGLRNEAARTQAQVAATDLQAASAIRRNRMDALDEEGKK